MSAEYPQDHDPQYLLQAKNTLHILWGELPPEHQATMLLVLLKDVMNSEYQAWIVDALARLYPQMTEQPQTLLPSLRVTRATLAELDIPDEQLASLTDDDLTTIASRIHSRYSHDEFWDELVHQILQVHTEEVLREKGAHGVD